MRQAIRHSSLTIDECLKALLKCCSVFPSTTQCHIDLLPIKVEFDLPLLSHIPIREVLKGEAIVRDAFEEMLKSTFLGAAK